MCAFFCLEEVVAILAIIHFVAADFIFARSEKENRLAQFHGVTLTIEAVTNAAHKIDNAQRSGAINHFVIDDNR